MIYLHRGFDRATAETEARALALEAQGFIRCSADAHRLLWQIADEAALAKLRVAQPARARVVSDVIERLPNGWARYRG